jgi:hypothetical protein
LELSFPARKWDNANSQPFLRGYEIRNKVYLF